MLLAILILHLLTIDRFYNKLKLKKHEKIEQTFFATRTFFRSVQYASTRREEPLGYCYWN